MSKPSCRALRWSRAHKTPLMVPGGPHAYSVFDEVMHDSTRNVCAWLLTASICGGLIALLRFLAHAGIVDKILSRKLLHTGNVAHIQRAV